MQPECDSQAVRGRMTQEGDSDSACLPAAQHTTAMCTHTIEFSQRVVQFCPPRPPYAVLGGNVSSEEMSSVVSRQTSFSDLGADGSSATHVAIRNVTKQNFRECFPGRRPFKYAAIAGAT
mmetsp:Transcript_27715/g.67209  ORF Transcript_27715/g.67209 Transcript_27715/m.67209 type:complete len:120 (+) Transcript_27715:173-532(+)